MQNKILSMLLWTWGGTVYFLLEVFYKTVTWHADKIHWSMLVLAIILSIPLERGGAECPWNMPLAVQSLICTILITFTEFLSGLVLNVWLNLGIWDYSHLWGNVMGQICPQFIAVWFVLCLIFIPIFDWLRYLTIGGYKPKYSLIKWG